ncbi:transcription termination factor NusA [Ruminococcus flavefaciens]|uniref:Transcription termination/antitermination protein NusA n=1 Tax=Ruminococcus flavefaciens TaxID=1265 RepID=A0A1K1NSK8_RUMFL|nr:transcription termination factor NusA [Ruminococcus flavefaciens]SFW38221.1 NusA antitermination factor [Ruminococcus flavefaciens]
MNMNKDFFRALEALGEENSVETELLIEKVKSAMLKAARRAYPHSEERISVEIDPKTKKFEMYIRQDIIDDEPIDENEVNIDVARTIDPNAMVGGTIMKELDISKLGRMAALSAKQSIKGDLREINREQMLSKFEQKEHECITAKVSQVEPGRGTVTVVYDGTELYLFRNEQIPGENLEEGKSVKVYITGIIGKNKKPVVKISRTHKDLVKRLFEQEVPEIYDGTVEVKSISREAGSRTKIAVWSKDENVDAVGACIGPKRSRITAVVNELSGEKIDIIPWSEVPEEFIARALAPAEVLKTVITSMEEKACTVIVPNNQLSLAIGNKGQNAKLAAKLTGFKIDIKPQFDNITGEEAPEMSPDFVAPVFEAAPPVEEEAEETAPAEKTAEAAAEEEAPANEE